MLEPYLAMLIHSIGINADLKKRVNICMIGYNTRNPTGKVQ